MFAFFSCPYVGRPTIGTKTFDSASNSILSDGPTGYMTNRPSCLDVISVGSESVNAESQINSSCINEFLSLLESAMSRTKQSGLLTVPGVKGRKYSLWGKIGASDFILKSYSRGICSTLCESAEANRVF